MSGYVSTQKEPGNPDSDDIVAYTTYELSLRSLWGGRATIASVLENLTKTHQALADTQHCVPHR